MFREDTIRAKPMRRERNRAIWTNSRGKTPLRMAWRPGRLRPAAEMMEMMPLPRVVSPTAPTRSRPA
jgi:hypothetical protein